MKINEIITENIFTCDYRSVMDAVAALYQEHYDVNIWNNAEAHDEAAQVLMKEHPSQEELEFIIDTQELPERFQELNFPLNDGILLGLEPQDSEVTEEPASRDLCTSGKPDSALGASQLASCVSQGYRAHRGKKSHTNIGPGGTRDTVRGKKIKGKKYGGPLPDWS